MSGTLTDTYVAALQHDLVDLPDGTRRVGVVRKPTRWFYSVTDDNRPALAPPESLLDDFEAQEETFALDGLCDEEAHNAAWDAVDFDERYREHLHDTEAARTAMDDLVADVKDGADVALVCYENTNQKRCHRTILRSELEARLDR